MSKSASVPLHPAGKPMQDGWAAMTCVDELSTLARELNNSRFSAYCHHQFNSHSLPIHRFIHGSSDVQIKCLHGFYCLQQGANEVGVRQLMQWYSCQTWPDRFEFRKVPFFCSAGGQRIRGYRFELLGDIRRKRDDFTYGPHARSDSACVLSGCESTGRDNGNGAKPRLSPGRPNLRLKARGTDDPRAVGWVGHSGPFELGAASCRSGQAQASKRAES